MNGFGAAYVALALALVSVESGCGSVQRIDRDADSGGASGVSGVSGVGGSGVGGSPTTSGAGGRGSSGNATASGAGGESVRDCSSPGPVLIAEGFPQPLELAADESNLYFATLPPDPIVARVSKRGGELSVLAEGLDPPRIALDGDVLWVAAEQGVFAVPTAGGPAQNLDTTYAQGVDFDRTDVFWTAYTDDAVNSTNKQTLETTTWGQTGSGPYRLVATSQTIYYLAYGPYGVQAIDRATLAQYTIGDLHVSTLLADGDVLYFVNDYEDAAVWRVDPGATEAVQLAYLDDLGHFPEGLATDGTMLYGGVRPDINYGDGGHIYRVPVQGGPVEVVSSAGRAKDVKVDTSFVYWVQGDANAGGVGQLMCAPKAPNP